MNPTDGNPEDFDFRDIALMAEPPVITRAVDLEDGENYYVIEVLNTDSDPTTIAMTKEALEEFLIELQEIAKDTLYTGK
jgi:hypothetical protein